MGVLSVLLVQALVATSSAAEPSGYWAKTATALQEVRNERRLIFPAPNGRAIALIDGARLWVHVDRRVKHLDRDVGVGWPAELGWSADSAAFFITQTDGGIDRTWYTTVFIVGPNTVRVMDPARDAAPRFRAQSSCATPDVPNAAVVAWLDGAKRLLVATEVPPHWSCKETGRVAGYVVSIPSGRIEREMTGNVLKREFGALLGPRLAP